MKEVVNTGERILLEKETPLMVARHFCAYKFAAGYVPRKKVLDIGCGEGYGSHYLAGFAKAVLGIDYDAAIVDYAGGKYRKDNLRFFQADANQLKSLEDKFEAVTSFQVIEHIREAGNFLASIKGLLQERGIFICSTPNKKDASPGSDTPLNKFHVQEYSYAEFKGLLAAYFQQVDIFGLKRGGALNFYRRLKKIGIFNLLPKGVDPVKKFYAQIDCDDFVIVKDNLDAALDFIAVCKEN